MKEVVTSTPLDAQIVLHAVTPFPAVMQTTFAREVRDLVAYSFCLVTIFIMSLLCSSGLLRCMLSIIGAWSESSLQSRSVFL